MQQRLTRPPRCMSAAALSAAVDSTYSQETAPNSQGHTVRKKYQFNPQPFFGWEREGGASCKEAASLAFPLVPHAACPRRLCQPPWTQPTRRKRTQLAGAYRLKEIPIQSPAVLRVGARGRRFLQRSGLPRIPLHSSPTPLVRGGSVSRRGLNLLAENRTQLAGAYRPKEIPTQSPAVLRVGARGRRFLQRSGLPRIPLHVPSLVKYCYFVISVGALVL